MAHKRGQDAGLTLQGAMHGLCVVRAVPMWLQVCRDIARRDGENMSHRGWVERNRLPRMEAMALCQAVRTFTSGTRGIITKYLRLMVSDAKCSDAKLDCIYIEKTAK